MRLCDAVSQLPVGRGGVYHLLLHWRHRDRNAVYEVLRHAEYLLRLGRRALGLAFEKQGGSMIGVLWLALAAPDAIFAFTRSLP